MNDEENLILACSEMICCVLGDFEYESIKRKIDSLNKNLERYERHVDRIVKFRNKIEEIRDGV